MITDLHLRFLIFLTISRITETISPAINKNKKNIIGASFTMLRKPSL